MVNKIPQVLVCTDVHLKLKHPLSMTWMLLQVLNIYISRHKVDILILCRRRYARGYLVRIRANIHNLYEEISRHFISWAFRSSQKKAANLHQPALPSICTRGINCFLFTQYLEYIPDVYCLLFIAHLKFWLDFEISLPLHSKFVSSHFWVFVEKACI